MICTAGIVVQYRNNQTDTYITSNSSGGFGSLDCDGITTNIMALLLGQLIVQFVQFLKRERIYILINESISTFNKYTDTTT